MLAFGVEVARGSCFDISIGGLGASVAGPIQLGQEVRLEFTLPPQEESLLLKAMVRHFEAGRCGFEFLTITPEDRDAILAYGDSLTKKKRPRFPRQ